MTNTIEPFVHRKVVILQDSASCQDAARAMRDHRIGCVLVMNSSGALNGIVTDRDFACRLATDHDSTGVPLSKIMTRDLIVADEQSKLSEIVQLMENYGVRRIPIVSRMIKGKPAPHAKGFNSVQEKCVGIVTLDDLIVSKQIDPNAEFRIIRHQVGGHVEKLKRSRMIGSQRRSRAHRSQTLDRFHKYFSQMTGVPLNDIPQVSYFILGSIVMRLPYSAAVNFVAQLPLDLQDPLLRLPPGPDRSITIAHCVEELASRFKWSEAYARSLFQNYFLAFQQWMDAGQVRHLRAQLPSDLRALFKESEEVRMESKLTPKTMSLLSRSFRENSEIPETFSGDGQNRSPHLEWSGIPEGTKEFALICEDPDAPTRSPWVHWVCYSISPAQSQIPEGLPAKADLRLPLRMRQGRNSWGRIGYDGPQPPHGHGPHRYFFKLYALDRVVELPSDATKDQLLVEMRGHILAEATLMGRYQRVKSRKAA